MKVLSSVKKICKYCKIYKRNKKIFIYCDKNKKHKQRQF